MKCPLDQSAGAGHARCVPARLKEIWTPAAASTPPSRGLTDAFGTPGDAGWRYSRARCASPSSTPRMALRRSSRQSCARRPSLASTVAIVAAGCSGSTGVSSTVDQHADHNHQQSSAVADDGHEQREWCGDTARCDEVDRRSGADLRHLSQRCERSRHLRCAGCGQVDQLRVCPVTVEVHQWHRARDLSYRCDQVDSRSSTDFPKQTIRVRSRRTRVFIFANNNDWSGPFSRWWAASDFVALAPGSYVFDVPLSPERWTSVNGVCRDQTAPTEFASALKNVSSLGVSFGAGCFYGHGVC